MNTAIITIKTDPEVKEKVQKVALDMGLTLTSLINSYLKHVVRTKQVEITLDETPNAYLKNILKQAEKNYKKGKSSPAFDDVEEAIKWLDDPKAKYQNGNKV